MTIILTLSPTCAKTAHVRQVLGAPAREIHLAAEAGGRPAPLGLAAWPCDGKRERAA